MAFSEKVINEAWERCGASCECMRRNHKHFYTPCGKSLIRSQRGESTAGGWEAKPIILAGGDTASNCEILCTECCNVIH